MPVNRQYIAAALLIFELAARIFCQPDQYRPVKTWFAATLRPGWSPYRWCSMFRTILIELSSRGFADHRGFMKVIAADV